MKSEYFILLPNNICNSLQSFATEEMNQRNILPINKTRILEAIANVIHSPHMNDKNSVILLNHGLHFITSTNFSTQREVIDRIVDLFKKTKKNDQGKEELKFKGKMIWKTNAAIHRERLRLPHHHKRRFLINTTGIADFCSSL